MTSSPETALKDPRAELIADLATSKDTSPEQIVQALEHLLTCLEDPQLRMKACGELHKLASLLESTNEKAQIHLMLRKMTVKNLKEPIKLLLTPAVFSPEMWGRTFAEGLLKDPDQFHAKSVVELGTGSGWISLLLLLTTQVKEILALDLNPVAVLLAKLNAWLNGTTSDGYPVTSQLGVPIVGALRIKQSDLLSVVIDSESKEKFHHIIGCIPQVLHPVEEHSTFSEVNEGINEKDLYDLSNYCFRQGILEDRFGLPLIARALEQSQICLKPQGKVTFIIGGRPGPKEIQAMFERRAFIPELVLSRRIPQADDTDLDSLVELERAHDIKFHFFISKNSQDSVSADTAVKMLKEEAEIYHDLLVYRAQSNPKFERSLFEFLDNLHKLKLDTLRSELDFSRLSEEQVSFLSRLTHELLRSRYLPYPHERGDFSFREKLSRFLQVYCHIKYDADKLFVGPERIQLLEMILKMVLPKGGRILLSESLKEVYGRLLDNIDCDGCYANDDLPEIFSLDDILNPDIVLIAAKQFSRPSPLLLDALFQQALKHPKRLYILDDSANFDIGSALDSNITLRLAGQAAVPSNLVFLYGLTKNTVCPDLELSFLLNAPEHWPEHFDVTSELSYSRISFPGQLYYEWLFDDLLDLPFPDEPQNAMKVHKTVFNPSLNPNFVAAASDPVFAPKPVDVDHPDRDLIRLDYGEFEHEVPDLLLKGLIKGFVEPSGQKMKDVMRSRIAAYMKYTRNCDINQNNIVLGQGVFPLLASMLGALSLKLGRKPLVALHTGSYGPLFALLSYHDARLVQVETRAENGFLLQVSELEKLSEKPDLIWITNPSNPSGYFYTANDIKALGQYCFENSILLLADEIFFLLSDIACGDWTLPELSFAGLYDSKAGENLFVCDGVAKSFAAGGLRCGFMTCPNEEWAQRLQAQSVLPSNVLLRAWDNLYSAFLEVAPHSMLDVEEASKEVKIYLDQARKLLSSHRNDLSDLLKKFDCDLKVSQATSRVRGGMFSLANLSAWQKELAIQEKLLLNPDDWSRTKGFSRICFSLPEPKWQEAMKRLRNYLERKR